MAEHKHDHEVHEHGHTHEHSHAPYVSNLPKFHKTATGKGTFYGVSVGPGDFGNLTLNAVQTIMHCPIIASPRTAGGEMLAYNIARGGISRFMELSFGSRMAEASEEQFWAAKTLLPLDLPMTKVVSVMKMAHRKAVDQIEKYLDQGLDVGMLNLGDVSIYATVQYIADLLKEDGYEVKLVAGVPSFCAAASALTTSLTAGAKAPVYIIPGGADDELTQQLLIQYGTKVLMKTARSLPETLETLKAQSLATSTSVVVNCGLPGEQVYENLQDFETALAKDPESTYSYFTILLVKPTEDTK